MQGLIEVKANGQTILKDDLWSILPLQTLRDGICRLNPEAEVEIFCDGQPVEKPFWWDIEDEEDTML